MKNIEYSNLQDLNQIELLEMLNKRKVRKHLVPHNEFNQALLEEWVVSKAKMNSSKGCKVRGIKVNGSVGGWCGIQFEKESYELALVLDEEYWGIGVGIFKEVMRWASELGHSIVVLHLLNTRPEYKFLRKMASRVYESKMFGQKYTSYELKVPFV